MTDQPTNIPSDGPSASGPGGGGPEGSADAQEGVNDRRVALRVVTMPKDTNQYGTIFGGVILSYIDQAGFVEARRHGNHRWVTASIQRVDFRAPVIVGDIVTLWTRTERIGRTSVTVCVDVEAERWSTGRTTDVTSAHLTMVAVDETGQPVPFAGGSGVKGW
ncbi:MAG: acyl-CoA thioesterase [Planctomycetota bacterium]